MGIFGFLNKRKNVPSDERMIKTLWDMWERGRVESPYAELMTYQSEINNGGHDQYFMNVGETSCLQREMQALDVILPRVLQRNLHDAYEAYSALAVDENDEEAESKLEKCDDVFYENEEDINCILKEYASKIE